MAHPVPTGTITFLFTDIEGSTRLWEQRSAEMKVALARHDQLLRAAVESNGGYVFKTVGDAFCAAFTTAMEGLHAALDAQRSLAAEPWKIAGGIRVRMGLHTGTAEERDRDYFGPTLNRTARLFSTGAGGQVLVSLVTAELLRDALPEDVGLRDLGAHRLKDLMRPESIFQVVAAGLPADFPPLKSLDNHPNNLPMQPTPFIGREKELESASRTILGEACRVLTLTGVGGAGKTRLALQAAANLTDRFEEGVYFVDLSAIDSPAFVLPAIARTLGMQLSGGRSALEVLRDALKERRVLLVLDNFEQVMRAVPNVVELLAACPAIKMIVTSREALHIRMENVLPIPPLSAPKVKAARDIRLDHLGQYESVSLFIERARAVQPDFTVTNETAPAVAEICARLDGLPLAIELAAARTTALSPRAILERLGDRLKLLTGGPSDLPFRQRTLRATIDWSYRMLSPAEQLLFRELSVFSGGATLEAAERVCACAKDGVDVLETLSSLVDKSLIWRGGEGDGEARFHLYETMKEYARGLMPQQAQEALRSAHAEFFLRRAEESEPSLRGPRQREVLDGFEQESENLQAAVEWFHARGAAESEIRLCVALTSLYQVRGFVTEGRENLQRIIPGLDGVSPSLRGPALLALARVCQSQGRHREALDLLESCQQAFRSANDEAGVVWAEYERGCCYHRTDRQEQAVACFKSVLDAAADEHLRALAELGIGSSKTFTGELDEAGAYLDRCRTTFSRLGDDRFLARTILSVLMVSYQKEDFPAALRLCHEALALQERLRDHYYLEICYNNLGNLNLHLQDFTESRRAYEKLLLLSRRSANRRFQSWACAGLAESLLGLGDLQGALANAERAVSLADELDTPFDRGVSTRVLGEVHLRQGRFESALQELEQSVSLVEKGGDQVEYRKTVNGLAKARILAAAAAGRSS